MTGTWHNGNDFRTLVETSYPGLSELLIEHDALIAGSSVLAALVGTDFSDFDIWVSERDSKAFLKAFEELPGFKKHNIKTKINADGAYGTAKSIHKYEIDGAKSIDILVCNFGFGAIAHVYNFDIDVCVCTFNGKDIFSRVDNIEDKVMTINNCYVKSILKTLRMENPGDLVEGNHIFSRLLKYSDRGFKLKIGDSLKEGQDLIDIMRLKMDIIDKKKQLDSIVSLRKTLLLNENADLLVAEVV